MKCQKLHLSVAAVAVAAILASVALALWLTPPGGGEQFPSPVSSYGYLSGSQASGFYQAFAANSSGAGTEVTVYNDNLALVKERRTISLRQAGVNPVQYTDVAALIQPDTVLFRDLTDPRAFVVEQRYEYDVASQQALLQRYLGRTITVTDASGIAYTGTLLSYTGGYVLQTASGVVTLTEVTKVEYPTADGLLVRPTLLWQVYTEHPGDHQVQTSYLTTGMGWQASYVLEVNPASTLANIQGWVTVDNHAGASFPGASLKLVAGEVHQVYDGRNQGALYDAYPMAMTSQGYGAEQFAEEQFFEYHVYTLGRTTDLLNNEMKQIALLSAENVPVVKELVFEPQQYVPYYYTYGYGDVPGPNTVQVMLNIENTEQSGLGMPLPAGVARIYQMDSNGSPQFAGEDWVDHSPNGDHLRIYVGNAFDVVGVRSETDYNWVNEHTARFTVEYTISNYKNESVSVTCLEHIYGDWEVLYASMPYTKKDATTLEFKLQVPANGEATATFNVMQKF